MYVVNKQYINNIDSNLILKIIASIAHIYIQKVSECKYVQYVHFVMLCRIKGYQQIFENSESEATFEKKNKFDGTKIKKLANIRVWITRPALASSNINIFYWQLELNE